MFVHKPILLAINQTELNRSEPIQMAQHTVKSAFDNGQSSQLAKSHHDSITLSFLPSQFVLVLGCDFFSLFNAIFIFLPYFYTVDQFPMNELWAWLIVNGWDHQMWIAKKKFAWIIIIGIYVKCNAHSNDFQFE